MFLPLIEKCESAGSNKKTTIIKKNLEEMFEERRSTLMILPSISRQVLSMAQSLPGCLLAGGAALELYTGDINKIKDWDLFFARSEGYKEAQHKLKGLGFVGTDRSEWSWTMEKSGVVVQLITRFYTSSPADLFNRFDFSVCCFAVKGPDIYYTEQAAEDVELKRLTYIYTDNIISSIKRVARYGHKGYMPTTQCVIDLLKQCKFIPEDGPGCS